MSDEKTLWKGDSEYTHYEVVEQLYDNRPARLLFSGQREAVQSGVALDNDPKPLFDYNQRFLELVTVRQPKRVLLVGGGALTLPTALFVAEPGIILDVIERDPVLTQIAADYFNFKPHTTVNVYHLDGRVYLERNAMPYDLVLMDVFSHLSIPASLSTVEAVQAIKRNLVPQGCVALNIVSPYYGRSASELRRQLAAYASVFQTVRTFPADATDSGWLNQNLVVVAHDGADAIPFRFNPLPPLDLEV